MPFCKKGKCDFTKTWRKIARAKCSICGKLDGSKAEVKSALKEARSQSSKTGSKKVRQNSSRGSKGSKSSSTRNTGESKGVSQVIIRQPKSTEEKLVAKSRSSNARLDEIPAGIIQGNKSEVFVERLSNHRYNLMALDHAKGNYVGLEHRLRKNKPLVGYPIRQNVNSSVSDRRKAHLEMIAQKRSVS